MLLISTIIWKQLSEEEQGWLLKAAKESAVYQRVLWGESEKESLEAVAKAGVEIFYPQKDAFIETVASLYEEYEVMPEISEMIKKIRAEEIADTSASLIP